VLLAGLNPKDFRFINDVDWIASDPGIRLGKYGLAYTRPFISVEQSDDLILTGFTVEIAFRRIHAADGAFRFIAVFHDGDEHSQLLLGQWRDWVILMNGGDYSHRSKTLRLSMKVSETPSKKHFITFTTGKAGTQLFLDGQLLRTQRNLTLQIPGGGFGGRLVLGNSPYRNNSLEGEIYGFAFYTSILSVEEIESHHSQWWESRDFSFAGAGHPSLLYLFNEPSGTIALDHSGNGIDLKIPSMVTTLERRLFRLSFDQFQFNRHVIFDLGINLFGFVPLGFVLAARLHQNGKLVKQSRIAVVLALGFTLSFCIEWTQSWMPSRDSSLLDLLLNSTGSYMGALMFVLAKSRTKLKLGIIRWRSPE
jgi:hypothetical protein